MSTQKAGSIFGGALLVAGTAIGAGMLALPVLTSYGGFIPAAVLCLIAWVVMSFTGLLFIELCLWVEGEPNIVSLAGRVLGRSGRIATWLLYIYFFYCLTIAYVSGGGALISEWSDGFLPAWLSSLLFILILGPAVYAGAKAVEKVNVWMVAGLVASYALFLAVAWPHVDLEKLARTDWFYSLYGLPIIVASFGYQGLVPSLTAYMKRNARRVAITIIVGSAIPLVCYLFWEWLILGIVPFEGPGGLLQALETGESAVAPLRQLVYAPWIFYVGQCFGFFALVSSFLGVSLGLRDFLADGLRIEKSRWGRFRICAFMFLPAYLIAVIDPRLFLLALQYGGGLGGGLLLVFLPTLLVWVGRYRKKIKAHYRAPGGRAALIAVFIFVALLIFTEIFSHPLRN
jgi:tyrosine-specific transport protein